MMKKIILIVSTIFVFNNLVALSANYDTKEKVKILLIGDSTTEENRSKGMGLMGAAMGVGMVLGPGLGGWLAQFSLHIPFFIADPLLEAFDSFAGLASVFRNAQNVRFAGELFTGRFQIFGKDSSA